MATIALTQYDALTPRPIFSRADGRATKVVTVKAGQVLKAYSFVDAITAAGADKGKVVASTGSATPYGVLCYDVDASGGDVDVAIFVEAAFWEFALVWSVNVATDKIMNAAGTALIACTAYDTGATTRNLKNLLVKGTEITLDFKQAGEVYNG